MQQTYLSGSSFFYSCYLLCNLRWIAITHKVQRHFGPRLQSTITRACAQASKQAYLSIWFSTLLSLGPHLWFCLSQWCHVLGDCGTILQGASKHITTLWRVRHQHDLDLSHFARTSECQAGLYIDYKVLQYVFLSVGMFHHIYIYISKNYYKFTQITNTRKTPVIAVLEQIAAPGGYRAPQSDMLLND